MMEDKLSKPRWKTRAVILRCPNDTFLEVLNLMERYPDCYVVYSRSSDHKLMINEEGW